MAKKTSQTDNIFRGIAHPLNIAQTMNEALWIGDENHKTVYVNPVFEKLSGYSLAECIGRDCISFFDEEGQQTIEGHHGIRTKGKTSEYEANMISKTGRKIPLWISGSPTGDGGTMGIFTNLTRIKELAKQETLSRQIIKNSKEAIVVLDKKRKIKLWNAGAAKIFDYEEKEVLGKSIDLLIPKDLAASNKTLLKEVEDKKYLRNYETQRLNKKGDRIDLYLSITKVMDEKNNFIGSLLIYQDITEQKRINTELQKRFEAIQDAYKELGLQKRQTDYLFEISNIATSDSPLETLEKLIVSAICMLTKCDAVILREYDSKRKTLKLKAGLGISQKWWDKNQISYNNSLAKDAIKRKRAIIIDNIDANPKHSGQKLLKSHKFTTLILIPLFVQKQILGSLSLYVTDPGKLRFIETDFLDKFGKQCSLAIKAKVG